MLRKLFTLAVLLCTATNARADEAVNVFAAASLKGALTRLSATWAAGGHAPLRLNFDSSGTLALQIEQGAAAQLFISADEKWMDALAKRNLIVTSSRADLLTNTLVLIAQGSHAQGVTLDGTFDLAALLGRDGRLAVGDPDSVPAGIYAKQALMRLGLWDRLKSRLAPAVNVRAALLLVDQGEAPAGIVYGTDAMGDTGVSVIARFPESSHDPITYPIALVKQSGSDAGARAVSTFLRSCAALDVFREYGFGVP